MEDLTNLNKIFWPKEKITKGDLIDYYRKMSRAVLPYLKDRALTLHRYPNGINGQDFYQKNMPTTTPSWVKTAKIKNVRYLLVPDQRSLLYLVNLASIDLHPFHARLNQLDYPDYFIIDLDPVAIDYKYVVETALAVHEVLEEIGAKSYCKTSGGKGMHIYVPLKAKYTYDQVKMFAQLLVHYVHERIPNITSLERRPIKRQKKVYLDILQNQKLSTVVSAYSVRPRPGAPVSTPLKWTELKPSLDPLDFNLKNAPKRFEKVGDLFRPILKEGIDLKACMKRLEKL